MSETPPEVPPTQSQGLDMNTLIAALKHMVREEVQNALKKSDEGSNHDGSDRDDREEDKEKNENDKIENAAISALTKKMDKLQDLVKGSTSTNDYDLDSMKIKGMKKLPPKFSMPDM